MKRTFSEYIESFEQKIEDAVDKRIKFESELKKVQDPINNRFSILEKDLHNQIKLLKTQIEDLRKDKSSELIKVAEDVKKNYGLNDIEHNLENGATQRFLDLLSSIFDNKKIYFIEYRDDEEDLFEFIVNRDADILKDYGFDIESDRIEIVEFLKANLVKDIKYGIPVSLWGRREGYKARETNFEFSNLSLDSDNKLVLLSDPSKVIDNVEQGFHDSDLKEFFGSFSNWKKYYNEDDIDWGDWDDNDATVRAVYPVILFYLKN